MLSQRSIGAAGKGGLPSDDEFNTVSFLSHFDGTNNGVNNVFDDSSSSNHTITANGNVTQGSFGPFARPDGEWGVAFEDGDSLSVASSSDFDFGTSDFCWECWVFQKSRSAFQLIMAQDDYSTGNSISCWLTTTGQASIYYEGGGTHYTTTATVPLNTWTHLAWVRKGISTDEFSIYINGTAEVSGTMTTSFNQDGVIIGQQANGDYDFIGSISNIRIVNGSHVYASNFTPSAAPLTAVTNTKLLTCQSNRFVDNSASAHTITPSGDAAVSAFGPFLTSSVYDAGVNGASAYFDGTGDWLRTNAASLNVTTEAFTAEAWIFPSTDMDQYDIIACMFDLTHGNNSDQTWSIRAGASNTVEMITVSGATQTIQSAGTVNIGQWNHVAISRNGTTMYAALNGTVTSASCASSLTGHEYFYIGAADANGSASYFFNGYISNVRYEIGNARYTSSYTPPTAPLTAVTNTKLLLNMADGQAIDSAAQNDLTLYGDAKISNTQSKFGGTSLALDGTGDYATLPPNSLDLGAGNFTLESWVYTTVTGQRCIVGATRNSDGSGAYMMNINYTGAQVRFFCSYNGGTVLNYAVGSGDFPTNSWTHLAVTRDGANLRVFIDGTQVGTTNTTLGSFAIDNASLNGNIYYIGRTTDGANEFTGFLDSLRASKTARYTSNFTPPTEPFPDKGQ